MPGVAKLMEIILKYFIHIPFIGNSVDFVIGGYKAGKEFFSVELCMECTDLLVFLYWCRELIRKLRFPCDRFCFFQKISFPTVFFRSTACIFSITCLGGYPERSDFCGYGSSFPGAASVTGISGSCGSSGSITY